MNETKFRKTTPEDAKIHLEIRKKIFEILEEHDLSVNDSLSILISTVVIAVMECTPKERINEACEYIQDYLLSVFNELKEFKQND